MRDIPNFTRDWDIYNKYNNGACVHRIAAAYGLSESRVYRVIRDCGSKDNGLYSHIMNLANGYGFDIWACNYAYHWLINYTTVTTLKALCYSGWTKESLLNMEGCGDRTADVISTAISTIRLDRR